MKAKPKLKLDIHLEPIGEKIESQPTAIQDQKLREHHHLQPQGKACLPTRNEGRPPNPRKLKSLGQLYPKD
jgi:hypothetical protein